MATTALYETAATISTTAYSLPNNSTTPASIATAGAISCYLDLSALTVTERYKLTLQEKVQSAGTQRVIDEWIFEGVQATPHFASPVFQLMHGWDWLVIKETGTDRSIGWSIRSRDDAVNVSRINSVTITGDGSATPFNV